MGTEQQEEIKKPIKVNYPEFDKLDDIKYQEEKVDNHDNMESMVDPNKMLEAMNDYASTLRNMMELRQRLNIACYAINARTARYQKSLGK